MYIPWMSFGNQQIKTTVSNILDVNIVGNQTGPRLW